MTAPAPTDAGALREALAREIATARGLNPDCQHEGSAADGTADGWWDRAPTANRPSGRVPWHWGWRNHTHVADALIAGSLDSLLAARATTDADLAKAREEIAGLKAALKEAEKRAKAEKDSADMYANAWVRELGGKLFPKRFHIDACVKTTRWMRERSDRLAVIEAEQKAGDLVREYGPTNEMVRARAALTHGGDRGEN